MEFQVKKMGLCFLITIMVLFHFQALAKTGFEFDKTTCEQTKSEMINRLQQAKVDMTSESAQVTPNECVCSGENDCYINWKNTDFQTLTVKQLSALHRANQTKCPKWQRAQVESRSVASITDVFSPCEIAQFSVDSILSSIAGTISMCGGGYLGGGGGMIQPQDGRADKAQPEGFVKTGQGGLNSQRVFNCWAT